MAPAARASASVAKAFVFDLTLEHADTPSIQPPSAATSATRDGLRTSCPHPGGVQLRPAVLKEEAPRMRRLSPREIEIGEKQ